MNAQKKFLAACYTIEGLNSFATVIYFNYLYFFFRDKFGFDNKHNLALAALIGLIYTLASWQAGKFAQRFGNFTALKIGFGVMAAGLAVGSQLHFVAGAIAAACVVNVGMCFTWPVLEALVAEGANPARAVGIYNITWAIANASAVFIGGTLYEKISHQIIFYVPLVLMVVQFTMVFWLEKIHVVKILPETGESFPSREGNSVSPARAKNFQRLAWLANPFAYIAINTLIAVLPGIAAKFQLSTSLAGFVCSLWCFARVAAFVALWRWTAWHYKFRWLAGAFALLIVSFAVILVVPDAGRRFARADFFRRGDWIDLLFVAVLFDGCKRHEKRARRHPRGGHRRGQLHRSVGGRGGAAIPAAISKQRRDRRERAVAVRLWRIDFNLEN